MQKLKKILLVEDDIFLVKVYENMMPKDVFEVSYVTDGSEVASASAKASYDLILLDIVMPQKDGYKVLKELQANPRTKAIPVFVLSKLSSKSDEEAALNLGAEKFLKKTDYSFNDVITLIEKRLLD